MSETSHSERTDALTSLAITLNQAGLKEGDAAFELVTELMQEDYELSQCRHLSEHMRPCAEHGGDPWECPDVLFCKGERGYGIPIRDGGNSYVRILYCPFCGKRLP